jgi:hypothetical protein
MMTIARRMQNEVVHTFWITGNVFIFNSCFIYYQSDPSFLGMTYHTKPLSGCVFSLSPEGFNMNSHR